MYSLFIGLTLGGIPIVRDLLGRSDKRAKTGMLLGFAGMVALAWFQAHGAGSSADHGGFAWMFLAGITGASAMILPGVSGGYLLLVMGAYVPILSGIDAFKSALEAADLQAIWDPLTTVVLPVGLGVLAGVALVSNALRYFLEHHRNLTLGVLLGLLVGAVVGLYPFQQGVRPELGDIVKGQAVDARLLEELDPEDWPTQTFKPTAKHLGGSMAFILIGFAVTHGIRKLGDGTSGNSQAS
jgi:putative membrane protein